MRRPGTDEDAADWLPYDGALALVLDRCLRLESEEAAPVEALGRALAEDVVSPVNHPPWDNSAMDGFAVRADDVDGASRERPVRLPVSDDVPAGAFPRGPLRPGTAARVMTGAPVPEGATGVVRVEHTDGGEGERVAVHADADARRNIRRAGEDVRRGDPLLRRGDEVRPGTVAACALAGRRRIRVGRRPRVAILSTGDELAGPEEYEDVLAGRRIADTNGPALAAQVRSAGAVPVPLGIGRDDPDDLRARLTGDERPWDALVTSAGVSVGGRDHVKEVLESMGLERLFWRVRARPGSALAFGLLEERPFWGVPGNPVSAMVAFEAFIRPALRKMAGHGRYLPRRVPVRVREEIGSTAEVTHFHRVAFEEEADGEGQPGLPAVRLTGPQGSGMLHSMAAADGLLVVPEGTARLEPGSRAWMLPLAG